VCKTSGATPAAPAGNPIEKTDVRGVVTESAYDALNHMVATSFPASLAENVSYDYDAIAGANFGIGRLASVTDASGTTDLVYDAAVI
jgi:YD repeat-containing protein